MTARLDRPVNAKTDEEMPLRAFLLIGVLRFTHAVLKLRDANPLRLARRLTDDVEGHTQGC